MLIHAQEQHARSRSVFFGKLGNRCVRSFINFRDQDDGSAGLRDAEDFTHVSGQVWPPEVCFDGGDEIEHAVRKRQLRNRTVADFDAAQIDPSRIRFLGCADAIFGIVDAVDFSLRSDGGQFTDGPATAATHIKDGAMLFDRDVR